ncbi:MAG: DciA family protein [Pseudonocardiaceae bacterium]
MTRRDLTHNRTRSADSHITRSVGSDTQRSTDPEGSADPQGSAGPRGADLARSALEAARAATRASGRAGAGRAGATTRRSGSRGTGARRRGWSGARPDDRDPQSLGRLAARLVTDRGWADRVSGGLVFGRWVQLVGDEVAEHAQPVSLREGELTVQASSTAWATQLRLLQRQLIARITVGVGAGVVTRLRVQGPATPSWQHGPRHVRGRGPRDTYG